MPDGMFYEVGSTHRMTDTVELIFVEQINGYNASF